MKNILFLLCLCIIYNESICQDVINPYRTNSTLMLDYLLSNNQSSYNHNLIFNNLYFSSYNNWNTFNSALYDGEYEICLKLHPWYYLFIAPVLSINPHPSYIFSISYNYETVSYPFHLDCSYSSGNCSNSDPDCSTHTRQLTLPVEDANHFTYLQGLNYFKYMNPPNANVTDKLWMITPLQTFNDVFSDPNNATLNSACFKSLNGITSARYSLPHSIIKYTLNLHCGPDLTYPVVKSMSYYYDNTRGRMRFYPFTSCNNPSGPGGTGEHDVIFFPEILNGWGNYDNSDPQIILTQGTLNYFPLSENSIPTGCNSQINLPNNMTDYDPYALLLSQANTYQNITINSNYIYPAPYTLLSSPLREVNGYCLAGYTIDPATGYITTRPGIRQSYFIDQNTDLNIINPTEKVIFYLS